MDSLISSVLTPNLSVPPTDKTVSAAITDLPPQLQALTVGDSLLLQTLIDSNAFKLGINLPVKTDVEGQSIPLNLKLEQPLPMPLDSAEPHQVAVKITARSGNSAQVQLTAVDNRQLTPQSPVRVSESPAINRTSAPPVPLLPVKLAPVVDKLMSELNFTPVQRRQMQAALPEITVKLSSLPAGTTTPESDVLAPLRQVLASLKTAPDVATALPPLLKAAANLAGQKMPSVVKTLPELTVLETPVGRVIPETPLKLADQTVIPLVINSVTPAPLKETLPPLLQALSKVFDLLPPTENPPARQLLTLLQVPTPQPELRPLAKILAPLPNQAENLQLATQILERIPAPGAKMMANLHAFYKAASTGKAADWFGEKLTAEISRLGGEGQTVMNRAGEFVTAHTRDTVSWRIIEMPFFDGSALAKIKLAVRKNTDEEEETPDTPFRRNGVRFLLETSFSRLGGFQFDGFSLPLDHRFDLVIRTSRPMNPDFVSHVMNLFKTSLHDVNYVGNININMQENFIRIESENNPQLADGIYI